MQEKTEHDREIEQLLLQACSDREISERTGLHRYFVGARVKHLYRHYGIKTDVVRRVQLTVVLFRRELCARENRNRSSRKVTARAS